MINYKEDMITGCFKVVKVLENEGKWIMLDCEEIMKQLIEEFKK